MKRNYINEFRLHCKSVFMGAGFTLRALKMAHKYEDTKKWWQAYLYELERCHLKCSLFVKELYENNMVPDVKLLKAIDDCNEYIWETHMQIERFN